MMCMADLSALSLWSLPLSQQPPALLLPLPPFPLDMPRKVRQQRDH
jgi:hypothetical protein